MSSLNLVCKNVHIGEEGPYGSCKDMTRAESQQHPQAPSSIKQNNVLWEDSWADVATGASASVSVDPNNSTGQLALGPQGYYHLKDMVSGANGQQSHQEAKKGLPTEDIYGQRGPSTGPFSIQSDKHSTKRDKVYGVIGKFGASPEDGAAIYVPLRPQISSDPNVMDTKKCSSSSNDENKSKIPDKNAENRVASLHHLPVSTSSTSSESGHGTMQTGAPSTKSGSTLNTSSESEILLGEHSTTAVPSESQRDEGSPETGSEVPRRSDASVPKSVSIRVDYNDRQLEAASHPLWNSAADHKYSGSSQPTALQKQRIGSSSGMLDLERGSRETLLSKRDNFNLHESTFSDSFSITPPLPPLSPPNTPPRSPSTSSGRIQAKYKLSVR